MRIKYASRRIAVKVKEDVYSKGVYFWELPVLKKSKCPPISRLQNKEIWSKLSTTIARYKYAVRNTIASHSSIFRVVAVM